jgi:hypothetical protein
VVNIQIQARSFGPEGHTEGLLDRAARLDAGGGCVVERGVIAKTCGVGQGTGRLLECRHKAGLLMGNVSSPSFRGSLAARTAHSGSAAYPSATDIEPAAAAPLPRARIHRPRRAHVFLRGRMLSHHSRRIDRSLVRQTGGRRLGGRRKAETETTCQRPQRGEWVGTPCIYVGHWSRIGGCRPNSRCRPPGPRRRNAVNMGLWRIPRTGPRKRRRGRMEIVASRSGWMGTRLTISSWDRHLPVEKGGPRLLYPVVQPSRNGS